MTPAWLKDAWLNSVYRGQAFEAPVRHYVALYSRPPGKNGEGEITAPSYSRAQVAFAPPREGQIENAATVVFSEAKELWGAFSHFAIFDAPSGGRMLDSAELDDPQWVGKGGIFQMSPGMVRIRFEVAGGAS